MEKNERNTYGTLSDSLFVITKIAVNKSKVMSNYVYSDMPKFYFLIHKVHIYNIALVQYIN